MNKVILIGRLVADPELKYTPSGKAVCNVTVAVDRQSKDGGTDFIDVVAWNKSAENLAQYMSKGRQLAVDGSLQKRSYEDKEGNKRWVTEVLANRIEFIGSKGNGSSQQQQPAAQATEQQGIQYGQPVSFSDEDLPF